MNTSSVARAVSFILIAATLGIAKAQPAPATDKAAAPNTVAAETANTWLVKVDGTATSDGILSVTVTPWDIQPIAVAIKVTKGESAGMVAIKLRDGFRANLDQDTFRVDLEGKHAIRILAKHNDHRFGVSTSENSASGIGIEFDREK